MKYIFFLMAFLFVSHSSLAQDQDALEVKDSKADSLYKEDQFYAGITYNLIGNKPSGLSQSGFSSGFHFGYIKDMPVNTRRNVAIGVGLGLSTNSFNQNMQINKDITNNYIYTILDENSTDYTKNKFTLYMLELPLEFRWRTSNATDYKFWRFYTGVRLSYILVNTSKFKSNQGNLKLSNIKDFNDFQYGLTISAGYNTWNIHFYYALNPLFSNSAIINGTSSNMNVIKIGLMFYIL